MYRNLDAIQCWRTHSTWRSSSVDDASSKPVHRFVDDKCRYCRNSSLDSDCVATGAGADVVAMASIACCSMQESRNRYSTTTNDVDGVTDNDDDSMRNC